MAALIQQTDPDIQVDSVEAADDAFAAVQSGPPYDAVVIAVTPCSHEDLGAICDRLKAGGCMPVVLVMADIAAPTATYLINLGIRGIVLNSASAEVLTGAIRMAVSGAAYFPPELLQSRPAGDALPGNLTQRELQILVLLGKGLSNKQIARRLHAKESTIKVHIHRLLRKLGVSNRTQAAIMASRHHLLAAYAPDAAARVLD